MWDSVEKQKKSQDEIQNLLLEILNNTVKNFNKTIIKELKHNYQISINEFKNLNNYKESDLISLNIIAPIFFKHIIATNENYKLTNESIKNILNKAEELMPLLQLCDQTEIKEITDYIDGLKLANEFGKLFYGKEDIHL